MTNSPETPLDLQNPPTTLRRGGSGACVCPHVSQNSGSVKQTREPDYRRHSLLGNQARACPIGIFLIVRTIRRRSSVNFGGKTFLPEN